MSLDRFQVYSRVALSECDSRCLRSFKATSSLYLSLDLVIGSSEAINSVASALQKGIDTEDQRRQRKISLVSSPARAVASSADNRIEEKASLTVPLESWGFNDNRLVSYVDG